MPLKIHIAHLVVDPALLSRSQEVRFREALTSELAALHQTPAARGTAGRDPLLRLAQRTARAIHDRLPRP